MATILFPTFDPPTGLQKRLAYPTVLMDTVRAASDAIDALELFRDLLLGDAGGPDSAGFMAFDAHGGDTGCQLRAGMLREAFLFHRQRIQGRSPQRSLKWIQTHLDNLVELRNRAKTACHQLTHERILPSKLGFGAKQDTSRGIVSTLGWAEPEDDYLASDGFYYYDDGYVRYQSYNDRIENEDSRNGPLDESDFQAYVDSSQASDMPTGPMRSLSLTSSASTRTEDSSVSTAPSSCSSSSNERTSPLETRWNLLDSKTMVRFIVFAYTLSKYKRFCRLPDGIGARLSPEVAAEYGQVLMEADWNKKNVEYKDAKIQRIVLEFRSLQSWLSDLSSAWICSLAERSLIEPNLSSLVIDTIQKSAKGLTAVACYPGYLLLREAWSRDNCTIIMIDRHFCDHGFHYNVFTATLNSPHSAAPTHTNPMGVKVHWTLSPASIESLLSSPDDSTPHLVVMGNSINGPYSDYLWRIPSLNEADPDPTSTPHCVPSSAPCPDNAAHVAEFLAADHDRLALSFFAAHPVYAFPLASGADESDFLDAQLDAFHNETVVCGDCGDPETDAEKQQQPSPLKYAWWSSRQEEDALGTGMDRMHVFRWQHMFSETKSRVAERVRLWQEKGELMPLWAPV